MSGTTVLPPAPGGFRGELAKLPAFLRRDFLIAWSYRLSFFSDAFSLAFQALLFYFIGLMVDPSKLPSFEGDPTTYLEFVAAGIALSAFVALGLGEVSTAIRDEQLQGTLESLLGTPTATGTIQLGSMVYELIYVPIRTVLFLIIITVAFGLDLEPSGLLPAAVIILAFIPFVWGLGIASAATVLTFKRGVGIVGLGATVLTLASGAYFPLELLPSWATDVAQFNPLTIAVDGMREAMLGTGDWSGTATAVAVLIPASAASLAVGAVSFRLALARERRRGTLGLY